MTQLEDLPPDQRAVLSLLLRQGKAYGEIAALLAIQERAVRDRAHAALAVLAPRQARELSAEQRRQIGEYLLGQQDGGERGQTRALLESSDSADAWARAISAQLEPLAAGTLPELPGGVAEARGGVFRSNSEGQDRPRSSRLGGALLLGGIVIVLVVAVVLILSSGGGSGSKQASTQTSGSGTSTSTSSTTTATPHVDAQIKLAPEAGGTAAGTAYVLSEGTKRAFYLALTGLSAPPSGSFYATWLTGNAIKATAIGVLPAPATNGQIEGGSFLPANPGRFQHIIVTRETSRHPAHPGPVVLSGAFSVG